MNVQRRDFVFVVTLAATTALPASGQDVAPAVGPTDSRAQSAVSIPNLSGFGATHSSGASSRPYRVPAR
jgi:hypothetical protein